MNRQQKYKNGVLVGRGIEWTDWTHNFTGGCFHRCRWTMPDGSVATCYAEEVATRLAGRAYRQGFEHHYFHPARLEEPLRYSEPAKIFGDSMSDLLGHWVTDEQIDQVFEVCHRANWHTFQFLTKNTPRLLQCNFSSNIWIGASSPPDFMWGKELSRQQQERKLHRDLAVLSQVKAPVRFMSFEPLSWDMAGIVEQYPAALDWAIIGAASNGNRKYQPDPVHVGRLLDVLDGQKVPVFFKGNLRGNPATRQWREFFPGYVPSPFMEADYAKAA